MKPSSVFYKIALILISIFTFWLYINKNTSIPPSLYSDEADINYQAYIFNQHQTDYFGNKFPLHFHSYSDWQPSFYIYTVAITQKIIGHIDAAARIPAAFYGALTILFFSLIVLELTNNHFWSILSGLLLSITPWLFHYSRTGFAVTNMLFLTLAGIYFWIKFVKNNQNRYLFLSLISFSLLTYSYSTAKLHLIFLFITLYLIWPTIINKIPLKTKIIAITLVFLICLPILSDTIKGRSGYRFSYINIFSDPTVSKTIDYQRQEDSFMIHGQQIGLKPSLGSKVFHNKASQWTETFLKNYFSSFSTDFLFLKGDGNLRQGIQTVGNLLFPDFFLIIIGISSIFAIKSNNRKSFIFILINLVLAPIPFALTRDSLFPHSTRLILMLPFLVIFSILGLQKIYSLTKSKFIISTITIIYLICFLRFNHQYFFHYPNISAKEWHFGMKTAVIKAKELDYPHTYFINSYEPFMPFFLNYTEYQPISKNSSPAQSLIWDNNQFFTGMQADNKYYLGNIEWSILFNQLPSESLFVVPSKELSRIQSSLQEYNNNHTNKINLQEIFHISKQYTEQEEFYLISFKQ